jgi:transcriptional regulator with XRE-family HTH domain
VHITNNNFGAIIKTARKNRGFTQEQLAEKINIGPRHIMAMENEGKTPSFNVLCSLVHELNISPEAIFYPEQRPNDTELDYLMRLLAQCSSKELSAVTALVERLI